MSSHNFNLRVSVKLWNLLDRVENIILVYSIYASNDPEPETTMEIIVIKRMLQITLQNQIARRYS